jgi:hypothetical protein
MEQMALQDRLLSLATKIIKIISLRNVALWSSVALVGLVGYTVFETRAVIINYFVNGPEAEAPAVPSFSLGETSRLRVKSMVDGEDLVTGAVILNADLRNNRRVPIFWYSSDPGLQKQFENLFGGRFGGIPLFTSDDKNNNTVVSMINGEFSCGTFAEVGASSLFPGLANRIPFICRAGIPPYYGQFAGYITLTLSRQPSPEEFDRLKSETMNISTDIFFRDVKQK